MRWNNLPQEKEQSNKVLQQGKRVKWRLPLLSCAPERNALKIFSAHAMRVAGHQDLKKILSCQTNLSIPLPHPPSQVKMKLIVAEFGGAGLTLSPMVILTSHVNGGRVAGRVQVAFATPEVSNVSTPRHASTIGACSLSQVAATTLHPTSLFPSGVRICFVIIPVSIHLLPTTLL